jgi:hypothetical protein
MQSTVRVFQGPDDVRGRLAELGLTIDALHRAIRTGYLARLGCNENDPPASIGILFWGRTTRGLREHLAPMGWKRSEAKLSLTVNAAEDVAIVVSTGDNATGLADGHPKTRFPKGPATWEAVAENAAQGELFPLELIETPPPTTWILLVSVRREGDKVVIHSELSLPSAIDEEGRVGSWFERVILPSIEDGDDGSHGVHMEGDGPLVPDVDVDVRRRATK